jgi:small subunit ribosomal protein S2
MAEKTANKKGGPIEAMFEHGLHFGYLRSKRHPSVKPFIFGTKNRVEIFDLTETEKQLAKAESFVEELGKEGKRLLFVGGKPEARDAIEKAGITLSLPYCASRWIGGTITNWQEIRKRLERLAELSGGRERGDHAKYTKWERLAIDDDVRALEENFGGIKDMKELPHALFIVDTKTERAATTEASRAGIPTIALMNSDCDVTAVTYPIVGNDATMQSISYVVSRISEAYLRGAKTRVTITPQEAVA